MREASCRPVRSEEDTLTGAPRWSLMLTFLSRSMPDTWRGDVFAVEERGGPSDTCSDWRADRQIYRPMFTFALAVLFPQILIIFSS